MRAGADYARSYVSKTRHGPLAKPSRRESEGGRERSGTVPPVFPNFKQTVYVVNLNASSISCDFLTIILLYMHAYMSTSTHPSIGHQ